MAKRVIIQYNPALKLLARQLRNNSTKSEIQLWLALKGKFLDKYDFHRQKPIDNFIVDFYCLELSLAIELDGISHYEEEVIQKDVYKEKRLNQLGVNILRFEDEYVYGGINAVLEFIEQYVKGFEKGDLSELEYKGSPLNYFSRG